MPSGPRAPVFYVEVDGTHLTLPLRTAGEKNIDARVLSFRYEDCETGDDLLELSFSDPQMEIVEGELLQEGKKVRVSWGYPGAMSQVRECVIKEVTPEFGAEITVKVKAFDKGSNLREGQSDKVWTNTTHAAIAREIAGRHRLTPVVDDTDKVCEALPQGNLTDYEFLARLAQQNGFRFYVENSELHWGKARIESDARFVLSYRAGRHPNLRRFVPESSSRRGGGGQARAAVKGFDLDAKASVSGVADASTPTDKVGGPNVLISAVTGEVEAQQAAQADQQAAVDTDQQSHADDPDWMRQQTWTSTEEGEWPGTTAVGTCSSAEEAQGQAAAQKSSAESKCWKARGAAEGDAAYVAKEKYEVRGVGTKYGGLWWAKKVTHTIASSGYECEFEFDRQGSAAAKGKSAAMPGKAECQSVDDHWEDLEAFQGQSVMPPQSTVTTVDAVTGEIVP